MEQWLESGDRAPDFSLFAAGSGRRVTLRGNAGRPIVLIFHLQGTAPTARQINRVAAIVILDRDSNVANIYQGERPVEIVREILEQV